MVVYAVCTSYELSFSISKLNVSHFPHCSTCITWRIRNILYIYMRPTENLCAFYNCRLLYVLLLLLSVHKVRKLILCPKVTASKRCICLKSWEGTRSGGKERKTGRKVGKLTLTDDKFGRWTAKSHLAFFQPKFTTFFPFFFCLS